MVLAIEEDEADEAVDSAIEEDEVVVAEHQEVEEEEIEEGVLVEAEGSLV